MQTTLLVIIGLIAVLAIVAVGIFNRLVALGRRCDQASSDIDVQLKQRNDLLPNLVETVKGYATHERGTLEAVIKARNASMNAPSAGAQMQAEAALGVAMGRLMAVAEAYPDLKASENFSNLQAELSDIENKIAAARRYLNSATQEYNISREQFPGSLIAGMFGFAAKTATVFEAAQRQKMETAPSVRF